MTKCRTEVVNDLSRSLLPLDMDTTLIAVVEIDHVRAERDGRRVVNEHDRGAPRIEGSDVRRKLEPLPGGNAPAHVRIPCRRDRAELSTFSDCLTRARVWLRSFASGLFSGL